MAVVDMKELLETGVHFGHRTRKWNPRMRPYIFTERNSIHIIDLQQTLEALEEAFALIRDTVAEGGSILFVGTKRQAQETIELEATRAGMPYVNSRWLGGTLTNWRTIRSRIDELDELERRRDEGEFELLTKKEALTLERRIDKLQERLGGIRDMKSVPELLFVVDVQREDTAVHEANLLQIPVIALVDTNCDPRGVDYVVPSNDDAIRAIKLLTQTIANAAIEGKQLQKDRAPEDVPETAARAQMAEAAMTDEELLGEATLAKLKTGEFDEKQAEAEGLAEAEAESEGDQPAAEQPEDEDQTEASAEAEVDAEAEMSETAEAAEQSEGEDQSEASAEAEADAEAEMSETAEADDEPAEADSEMSDEAPADEQPEESEEDSKSE